MKTKYVVIRVFCHYLLGDLSSFTRLPPVVPLQLVAQRVAQSQPVLAQSEVMAENVPMGTHDDLATGALRSHVHPHPLPIFDFVVSRLSQLDRSLFGQIIIIEIRCYNGFKIHISVFESNDFFGVWFNIQICRVWQKVFFSLKIDFTI